MPLLPFGGVPGLTQAQADALYEPLGGGGALAVQDINRDQVSATTLYTGIAAKGTAASATGWTLAKFVLTGNDRTGREVHTATDSWENRLTASYTLSNTYNV